MNTYQLFFGLIVLGTISCKKEEAAADPCADTYCLNGGTCDDGTCACPTGYTGTDCGQQALPSRIYVHSFTITSFLVLAAGDPWDPDGGPDLHAELGYGSNSDFWESTATIVDADPAMDHTFVLDPPLELTDTDGPYRLVLWDIDADTRQWMGGNSFFFYDLHGGFPTEVIIDSPGGIMTAKANISYTW